MSSTNGKHNKWMHVCTIAGKYTLEVFLVLVKLNTFQTDTLLSSPFYLLFTASWRKLLVYYVAHYNITLVYRTITLCQSTPYVVVCIQYYHYYYNYFLLLNRTMVKRELGTIHPYYTWSYYIYLIYIIS